MDIEQLKRRKLVQWALAYVAGAWALLQGLSLLSGVYAWPAEAMRLATGAVFVGLPIVLVLAWFHGEQGRQRASGGELAILTLLLALGGAGLWAVERRMSSSAPPQPGAVATTAPAPVSAKSIAVLPFADMSAEHDQEYFSDGIAEELLNRLAQFPDLRVAARTSAFQFKGKNLDIADIGQKLKVAHVLEGSVRKSGTKLRITAQLIRSDTGFHLWSQSFDRDAADVLQVQDEIASAIAAALEAKLSGKTQQRSPESANAAAYDEFLKGRDHFARRTGDNLKLAVAAFDRAIALDPGFSRAHSGRAFALAISTTWEPWMTEAESGVLATASAERALELDPDNAEAYLARGIVRNLSLRMVSASEDFERAFALAPDNVDVLNFYGDYLDAAGDFRRAEAMKRTAMALDPLAFVHPMNLTDLLIDQGRDEEARLMAERALALAPSGAERMRASLFVLDLRLGRAAEAESQRAALCKNEGTRFQCLVSQATLEVRAGRKAAALRIAAELERHAKEAGIHQGEAFAFLSDLYANTIGDIGRAKSALRIALDGTRWAILAPLHDGLSAARLPEEVSDDPEWLALWDDPILAEQMAVYRANVRKFRAGG